MYEQIKIIESSTEKNYGNLQLILDDLVVKELKASLMEQQKQKFELGKRYGKLAP